MANLLLPFDAYSLVKKLKESVKVPIHLHTHNTTGTGDMTYLMATQAGVDIVDCALSPFANGTANPSTESLVATLKGTEYDTGLDLTDLSEAAAHFRSVADKMKAEGTLDPKVLNVDTKTLIYQVPGGMLSNLISQLKQAGQEDKFADVLAEVPKVRKDCGYPPLVTPSSQFVGTQAVFNVIGGERYKMVTKEFKGLVKGEYGRTPVAIDPDFRKKIIGDEEPIDCRPADLLKPELEKFREECKQWTEQEEDVLTFAQFDKVAVKFFENRANRKYGVDGAHANANDKVSPV
jgi:oxaloacetate decarboxylase alpha subunit